MQVERGNHLAEYVDYRVKLQEKALIEDVEGQRTHSLRKDLIDTNDCEQRYFLVPFFGLF